MAQYLEWDENKFQSNYAKHKINFADTREAFLDPQRIICSDIGHGHEEPRYYCFGKTYRGIMTVRFTVRRGRIRIYGAGFCRKQFIRT